MTQRLFELSDPDKTKHVERRLRDFVEAETKAVEKAEAKLEAAIERADAAKATLHEFILLMESGVTVEAPASNIEQAIDTLAKAEDDRHVTFRPDVHVLVTDLDNQYGTPLIPAMCRTTEVLFTTHNGSVKSCITKAYADEAGFRLKGTLIAAGSTNDVVQDSLHRVQCLSDVGCDSQLSGYCTAPFTCSAHVADAQLRANAENARAEERDGQISQERIEAIIARCGHVQGRHARIIKRHFEGGDFAKTIREEWGTGGFADHEDDGTGAISVEFSPKCLRLRTCDEPRVEKKLTWLEVANITGRLIHEGVITAPSEETVTVTPDNICPDCKGDGRIPDKSGGGHHGKCKTCGGTGKWMADEPANNIAAKVTPARAGYLWPTQISNLVSGARGGMPIAQHCDEGYRFDLAMSPAAVLTVTAPTEPDTDQLLDTVDAIEAAVGESFGEPETVGELIVYTQEDDAA